jgi:magnesium chelatase subunit I
MTPAFPFTALVGQGEMKLALVLAAIDPRIGGVLALGDRGTGKSTIVRGLAALLPPVSAVKDCPYHCDPASNRSQCPAGCAKTRATVTLPVPVVDLPLGATEDRVVGALDLEKALTRGEKAFEPGLLARANRGFLYIDEVNLLDDHLVDLLIDVAASGENVVEREGLSVRHPARFVLIGSGNPEEGELRPQLLDRFGLAVEVTTPSAIAERVEIVRRRDAFEQQPQVFAAKWEAEQGKLRSAIVAARKELPNIDVPEDALEDAARLCVALKTDGVRGELTIIRACRALAAYEGAPAVTRAHIRQLAAPALRHRLRRDPLDEAGSSARVARAVAEVLGPVNPATVSVVGGTDSASASRNGHDSRPVRAVTAP